MSDQTNKKDDGGPAFGGTRRVPKPFRYDDNEAINYIDQHYPGNLSMRDYFAARVVTKMIDLSLNVDGGWDVDHVSAGAYDLADAMLRARNT